MIHKDWEGSVVLTKVGRVCVPIDSRNPENFDPMAVPTVTELLAEIDAWERENGSGGKIHGM